MKLDVDHVLAFRAVASEGSFTKAAVAQNSCQSRVSAKVKALEERLGTRLFTRSTRFVELTKSGQLLLSYANQLAESVSAIESVADTLRRSCEHVLRMGAPGCTASTPERNALTEFFARQQPEIQLEIEEGMPMDLLDRLHRHQIDIAIIPGPLADDGLELLPICTFDNMLIIPENHLLARLDAIPPARMKGQEVVVSRREVHPAIYDHIVAPLEKLGATIVTCPETHTLARMRYAWARGIITWCQGWEGTNFAAHRSVLRRIIGVSPRLVLYLVRRKNCELAHVDAFWSSTRRLQDQQRRSQGVA